MRGTCSGRSSRHRPLRARAAWRYEWKHSFFAPHRGHAHRSRVAFVGRCTALPRRNHGDPSIRECARGILPGVARSPTSLWFPFNGTRTGTASREVGRSVQQRAARRGSIRAARVLGSRIARQFRLAAHRCDRIIATDSDFSKAELVRELHLPRNASTQFRLESAGRLQCVTSRSMLKR